MNAKLLYATEIFTDDFDIDLKEKSRCKGIGRIEVRPNPNSLPIIINDGSEQLIDSQNPFVLQSNYPIKSGLLRFSFVKQQERSQEKNKKVILRYLFFE